KQLIHALVDPGRYVQVQQPEPTKNLVIGKSTSLRLELLGLNPMDLNPVLSQDTNYQIELFENKLSLYQKQDKHHVFVDFNSKQLNFRSQAHINAELVNKAVLGKKKQATTIMDCTAGFGKDSYLMSLTGSQIIAYESNPLMYALLKDGLNRANIDTISLRKKDALKEVKNTDCEVIYIDPMYPTNKKSAKNNKHMMFLQAFVGHQAEMAEQLFTQALLSKAKKIVIKRPVKAAYVLAKKPTSQIVGKAARFDIYAK
ncbi:MAG: class I SAM-dependent methyltransferase, partial [Alcanivoracaceae bacterium]|nr:class I SAM-dependent methyltransferase [Alcanivoracaceae bacterium]